MIGLATMGYQPLYNALEIGAIEWSFLQNEISKSKQWVFLCFNKTIGPLALIEHGMIMRGLLGLKGLSQPRLVFVYLQDFGSYI